MKIAQCVRIYILPINRQIFHGKNSSYLGRIKLNSVNFSTMNYTTHHFVKVCDFAGRSISFIVLRFPSEKYIINQIVLCAVNCVLIIPTVLLNGMSILTILKCSKLQDKIWGFLILVQSTVDFAVGLISLPMFTYIRASEIMEIPNNCVANFLSETVTYTMFGLSLAVVCVLTLERYMSIIHPVAHRTQLTKRTILVSVLCIIMAVLPFSLMRLASENVYRISGTALVFMSLAINTFAYVKIFLTARKKIPLGNNVQDSSTQQTTFQAGRTQLIRELKLAKSCALVAFTSLLCFLPAPVIYLYYNDGTVDMRIAHSWSITVGALNSCLNSVIFFWKRPLLRGEALKVLQTMFHN